jgi:hypothetical protein
LGKIDVIRAWDDRNCSNYVITLADTVWIVASYQRQEETEIFGFITSGEQIGSNRV